MFVRFSPDRKSRWNFNAILPCVYTNIYMYMCVCMLNSITRYVNEICLRNYNRRVRSYGIPSNRKQAYTVRTSSSPDWFSAAIVNWPVRFPSITSRRREQRTPTTRTRVWRTVSKRETETVFYDTFPGTLIVPRSGRRTTPRPSFTRAYRRVSDGRRVARAKRDYGRFRRVFPGEPTDGRTFATDCERSFHERRHTGGNSPSRERRLFSRAEIPVRRNRVPGAIVTDRGTTVIVRRRHAIMTCLRYVSNGKRRTPLRAIISRRAEFI